MLSATTDPYYVAKEEVEVALKKVKSMHANWKRILDGENTAKSNAFQELHVEIAGELRQLEFDFQDITATISMVEENRQRFKFDDAEINSRKQFVLASRQAAKEISESVNGAHADAKMATDKRELLMGQQQARKAAEARQSNNSQQNEAFISRQRQDQQMITQQQDDVLLELSKSAERLGQTAKTINIELQDHQRMLEELDEDIDRETEKLNFVMKRMGRLLKTSDNKQLCVIIGLVILAIVLLFLVIS
jgi:hypothetical protein